MSWLKSALTISTLSSNTYFTTVDPAEFYEWRFQGIIPKGTRFSKILPRSDTFTTGSLIVNAELDPNIFDKKGNDLVLTDNVTTHIMLTVGYIASPHELIEKYQMSSDQFDRDVGRFRTEAARRIFWVSKEDPAKLYRLVHTDDSSVYLENYGSVKEVFAKLRETGKMLEQKAGQKQGRAREMDTWRRYDNIMTHFNNGTLPLDTAKLEFVLKAASLKVQSMRSTSWKDFYIEMFPDVQAKLDNQKEFMSKNWVKHTLTFLSN